MTSVIAFDALERRGLDMEWLTLQQLIVALSVITMPMIRADGRVESASRQRLEAPVEPVLTAVATAALLEGVTFLYAQATEVLKAWRARRREGTAAPAPTTLPPPDAVTVGPANPLPDPRDPAMEDRLADLRDLAEDLTTGKINPDSPQGRRVAADLRDYLEVVLRAPIAFVGEGPRTFEAGRVEVLTANVEGDVAGVRAHGSGQAKVGDVRIVSGEVGSTGRVTGVEYT